MNQNNESLTGRRTKLESLIKETEEEKLVGYTKAAGGILAPIAALGGIATFCGYTFENQGLANLVAFELGLGIGIFASSGYIKSLREVIDDIEYASHKLKRYKSELKDLE